MRTVHNDINHTNGVDSGNGRISNYITRAQAGASYILLPAK